MAPVRTRLSAYHLVLIDGPVLVFTGCAGLLSTLLFGLLPGWHLSRSDESYETLKEGGRSETQGHSRQAWRSALAVVQIALASILLFGSGLLLRTLANLQSIDPGFHSKQVMTAAVALPLPRYKDDRAQVAFLQTAVANLAQHTGIASAAAASAVPFSDGDPTATFDVEGRTVSPGDPGFYGSVRYVSPRYFDTLGIRLKAGRYFNEFDQIGSPAVAIIDENLARKYWPNQDPLGRRLRAGPDESWATVIGIVGHVKQSSLASDSGRGTYYFSLYQQPSRELFLLARGGIDSNPAWPEAFHKAVAKADPVQALFDHKTMDQRMAQALGSQQFTADILIGFAGMALFLSATGLYGVISYSVAQRTREIGIRSALGANRSRILGLVLSQTFRLLLLGLVPGYLAALFFANLFVSQLFRVRSFEFPTLASVAIVLTSVSLLATALPAWRAMHIDPVAALRSE